MKQRRFMIRIAAVATASLVALAGCRGGGSETETANPGVSSEPCPEAVNPDNGCLYLGVISDLTRGPFAQTAVPLTEAQGAFWQRVNEQGGVGGYDIDISTHTADAEYNPELHNRRYQEMRGEIVAMAQTLGSSQTMAILGDMETDNMVGAPASFNSAWEFEPNILPSGANYCFETMNGVDWAVENRDIDGTVLAIGFPNDYGRDGGAGAQIAAEAQGLDFIQVETPPGQDNQAGAVAAISQHDPDLVIVSTGPVELATIVAGAVDQGYDGTVVGSSVAWNAALLQSPAITALEQTTFIATPWGGWETDSAAHAAIRERFTEPNEGYVAGWMWSYPVLAALQAAAELDGGITRENVRIASGELTQVDYEGALPAEAGSRVGDPNDRVWRASVINEISAGAPTGLSEVQAMSAGPTAESYDFTQPCVALG